MALSCVQPAPRPARKSEWLRSTLAHYHRPDLGAENEIVVLATGIDQYLQEVFHHIAHPHGNDTVAAEDFSALCAVLGLAEQGERRKRENGDEEEFRDVCSGLPPQLTFKEFHWRLCEYFRVRSARHGTGDCAWRVPVTEDTELIERQIRLRWPRVRRRKCVSFDLRGQNGNVTRGREDREPAQPEEVAALRELVEDLRSALQGSDARCLALEVALRRQRSHTLPTPSTLNSTALNTSTSITFIEGKLKPTTRIKGLCSGAGGDVVRRVVRRCNIRDPLLRELKLIRSSRDGQLQEAIRFNERLEEELRWAYQQVQKLQGVEAAVRKDNARIRRRAEEARKALSLGLQRVRLIQEQAQSVPQLQYRISQLEAELQQYRSCCICIPDPTHELACPVGAGDTCTKTESLQRAVEGRAASDEEEEDRAMKEEGQCHLLEMKQHVNQLHDRSKGLAGRCLNVSCQHPYSQSHLHKKNHVSMSTDSRELCGLTGQNKEEGSRNFDNFKQCDVNVSVLEDKGRTRLSLLEEKLTDALTLLLQLRNKNVSRQALGKIVIDTLDMCNKSGHSPSQVLQVADALCARLSATDLLGESGDNRGEEWGDKFQAPSS
ncbi:EF-hand and coiled-coil domain-containing protein 1 [Thalassophryne amazonica]|uniref:EF-hand and coiled-coil domain-containing protein 1 n=1 Tax=Thalassophryne amazonica TaxID=390379 RepID=UPI0014724E78|nr:EF-hand and coiled-coil domain-containing protein 1 [Thalassophryne amazonica]